MDAPCNDCGQIGVEFEDFELIVGTKKAREICREYAGQTVPPLPPNPRAKRNEKIKTLYFEDRLTQEVIAQRFGISQRWVSHIINCNN